MQPDLKVGIGGLEGRLLKDGDRSRLAKRSVILWKRRALNSCWGQPHSRLAGAGIS